MRYAKFCSSLVRSGLYFWFEKPFAYTRTLKYKDTGIYDLKMTMNWDLKLSFKCVNSPFDLEYYWFVTKIPHSFLTTIG